MEDRASSPINSGLAQGFWLATRKPVNDDQEQVYWISKSIHRIGRFRRRALLLLAALGPGIITTYYDIRPSRGRNAVAGRIDVPDSTTE